MGFFKRLFNGEDQEPAKVEKRTLLNLRIGDFVTYDLTDYEVTGKIEYDDGGYRWTAYQLNATGRILWLSTELDDELDVGMYEPVRIPGFEAGAAEVAYDGRTYYLEEQGRAHVEAAGTSRNVHGKHVDYYDYADETGESFLSVEVWGGDVEVSHGHEIEEFEVTILAGS
ncbi:DUF4178 domain-containing protein [Planococcus lenghuensis]|uniref:DUF4178 domain-containing protein n=1 Tax=Planococcus lenghuensis TaxID=2213202 RepID=A0A1Q2L476_9BACL|nr:DUF4178 domain-containing protein [Planococcus lenghuensis]AQQ54867.1 hypothetical protein B0X71_18345 [Planococcus lenghuensis]